MRKFLIGALMIMGGVYSSAIEYTRDKDEAFSLFLENVVINDEIGSYRRVLERFEKEMQMPLKALVGTNIHSNQTRIHYYNDKVIITIPIVWGENYVNPIALTKYGRELGDKYIEKNIIKIHFTDTDANYGILDYMEWTSIEGEFQRILMENVY